MKADYIIRQGEELSLSLLALEGEISGISSIEAVLKPAGPNGSVPTSTTTSVGTFVIDDILAPDVGWTLIMSGTVTNGLKPGFYVTNAKLNLISGGPLKTDHIVIEIKASPS